MANKPASKTKKPSPKPKLPKAKAKPVTKGPTDSLAARAARLI